MASPTRRHSWKVTATGESASVGAFISSGFRLGRGKPLSGPLYGCGTSLTNSADDERPEQVGDRQWQALPGGDEHTVFRVQRVVVGNRPTRFQTEPVVQLFRFEAPVVLERK